MMKMKFKTIIAAAAILLVSICSCKKEEPTNDYFSGEITLPFPEYVNAGYTKTFSIDTLTVLKKTDGSKEGIGYYYTDVDLKRDTLKTADGAVLKRTFTVTAPSSLETHHFSFSGYAAGYYGSAATAYFTVVSEDSITGMEHAVDDPSFTDPRDGRKYYTAEGCGLEWMASNLTWKGAGFPYLDCPAMTPIFGNYYTWEEAQTVCPEGWRLPTDAEWTALAVQYGGEASAEPFMDIKGAAGKLMAIAQFNNETLWEYWPQVGIDNASGLTVLPFGYAMTGEGSHKFDGYQKYAAFWTADQEGGYGVYRLFYDNQNMIFTGRGSKTDFAASVRCVR